MFIEHQHLTNITFNNINDLKREIYNMLSKHQLKGRWYKIVVIPDLKNGQLTIKIRPFKLFEITSEIYDFYFVYNTKTKRLQIPPIADISEVNLYINTILSIMYNLNKLQIHSFNLLYKSILDELQLDRTVRYIDFNNNKRKLDKLLDLSNIIINDESLIEKIIYINNVIEDVLQKS